MRAKPINKYKEHMHIHSELTVGAHQRDRRGLDLRCRRGELGGVALK